MRARVLNRESSRTIKFHLDRVYVLQRGCAMIVIDDLRARILFDRAYVPRVHTTSRQDSPPLKILAQELVMIRKVRVRV